MIVVATHKKFNSDILMSNYKPVLVGALNRKEDFGYIRDDNGDNISSKNGNYCELTGLYYIIKNYNNQSDYLGLVHYRRYFVKDSFKSLFNLSEDIVDNEYIANLLKDNDVILPVKRRYPFISAKEHYIKNHNSEDLEVLEKVLQDFCPEYLNSYNQVMSSSAIHLYNMFILKKDLAEEYLFWLFDILSRVEEQLDISDYDSYQSRVFGFLSERLLNVWVNEKQLKVKTLNLYEPDGRRYVEKAKKFLLNLK
ncbi:DUF4422 domain-containing protein [Pseudoalteromonas marina]|uniref:DUF4422 domain-containing protein n=1 Tax=Pseudoalteromonas marina TaxID=267375 RepID=A0ABT9FE90_9GAMM|nr:DUF4422 domain-containing protein [Pseudoalteromonas marina]MDP2564801.1 DUF4422 domain-containing protein [Pseudoalteromonas marina]